MYLVVHAERSGPDTAVPAAGIEAAFLSAQVPPTLYATPGRWASGVRIVRAFGNAPVHATAVYELPDGLTNEGVRAIMGTLTQRLLASLTEGVGGTWGVGPSAVFNPAVNGPLAWWVGCTSGDCAVVTRTRNESSTDPTFSENPTGPTSAATTPPSPFAGLLAPTLGLGVLVAIVLLAPTINAASAVGSDLYARRRGQRAMDRARR